MTTFWSFDPDGQNPVTADLCHYLGLPISPELRCWEWSWPTGTYKALQTYQIARGFDPNALEFARHNQYRVYEATERPLPSRFKEMEESEPTESPLRSVYWEEFDNMFLGVLSSEPQPEDTTLVETAQIDCNLSRDLEDLSPSEASPRPQPVLELDEASVPAVPESTILQE
ncbi:hypothetical protein V5O48_017799, partial [Marasmius crinis-equi]